MANQFYKKIKVSPGIIRRCCILLGCIIFFMLIVRYNQIEKIELISTEGRNFETARVTAILEDNLRESGIRTGYQTVMLQILTGEHKGEELEATSSSSYLYGAACEENMKVVAIVSESAGEITASVYSYYRFPVLLGFVLVFLFLIWFIGGKQGLYSIIGLIFTFVCMIYLFLPMIYKGVSPCLAAEFLVILTTIVTMYLIGGASRKTISAIIGTVVGVLVSGISAFIVGKLGHITGYNVSDIEQLIYVGDQTGMKVGELLFAGILIASLGAVMDVAMSVSSTISEINIKNPSLSRKELFLSGIHVGRDMMGTMSNTLILAFTGGSINTLVYMYSYNYSGRQIMNMNDMAIEIIQGISSSMGVILTVPFVAFFSSWLIKREQGESSNSECL